MTGSERTEALNRIDDLRVQATYHRERHDLYRAKMYGMRPTTMTRLRELARADENARQRLHDAEDELARHPEPPAAG